jgi:hypothetical protein
VTALRIFIGSSKRVVSFSALFAVVLTLISLFRLYPIHFNWGGFSGGKRGFPFYFVVKVYGPLGSVSNGFNIINILMDLLIWFLVSFVTLAIIRQVEIKHNKPKNNSTTI